MWAYLSQRLADRGVADDNEELKKWIEEEWAAIPMSVVNRFVASFKSNLEKVRKSNGDKL
jgi:hypothetical protein